MNDNAFDEALRRVVADEKLPDAPGAWGRMAARLDAHSAGKKRSTVVIPLPVIRWAAAAAVVAAALAAGWWLRDASTQISTNEHSVADTKANVQPNSQSLPATASNDAVEPERPNIHDHAATAKASRRMPDQATPNDWRTPFMETSEPGPPRRFGETVEKIPDSSIASSLPSKQGTSIAPAPDQHKLSSGDFAFLPEEREARKAARGTGFDVAGGYGFGGEIPAFSVGVSVKQPLTRRLQLEGALALVGTTPDPFGSSAKSDDALASNFDGSSPPTSTPGVGSTPGTVSPVVAAQQAAAANEEYEDIRTRQLFVQAAPVLMYRVAGGFSAGGGLDAQRRVSSSSARREEYLNSFSGVSVPALPDWDFGLALRADYRMTKKLRFGVQYRESLRATTADGGKAAGRNYWLVQAGYRIR